MDGEEKGITIESGLERLEGLLAERGRSGLLACHPHPLYGGDMHNEVIERIVEEAGGRGYSTLRFNYRGVGASTGSYSDGEGEIEDCIAAAALLSRVVERIYIAGYSFGSYVGLRAASRVGTRAAVGIAPPTVAFDFNFISMLRIPVALIIGGRDDFSDVSLLKGTGAEITVIEEADHFWRDMKDLLAEKVLDFFDEH